jgi:PAS domain S-box-containing protein
MPRRSKVTDTIFARGVSHLAPTINAIDARHGIAPAEFTRKLLEAACKFYKDHGWFSFPVKIEPEEFQPAHAYPMAAEAEQGTEITAIVECDHERRVVKVDDQFTDVCGYTFAEVQGKKLGDFLHGADTDKHELQRIREALDGRKPVQAQLTNYAKDGRAYRISLHILPISTGYVAEVKTIIPYGAPKPAGFEHNVLSEVIALKTTRAPRKPTPTPPAQR